MSYVLAVLILCYKYDIIWTALTEWYSCYIVIILVLSPCCARGTTISHGLGDFGLLWNRRTSCTHLLKDLVVQCRLFGRRQVMPAKKHFSWMIFNMLAGQFNAF